MLMNILLFRVFVTKFAESSINLNLLTSKNINYEEITTI